MAEGWRRLDHAERSGGWSISGGGGLSSTRRGGRPPRRIYLPAPAAGRIDGLIVGVAREKEARCGGGKEIAGKRFCSGRLAPNTLHIVERIFNE
ncbi:MAG: hypothetical protein LBF50_10475 [Azoarcus sp.]|nr:hypothetical protein [Azoarcus sp.]